MRLRMIAAFAALALAATTAVVVFPGSSQPASAYSYTTYKCALSGCKYGKFRAGYDTYSHRQFAHRGATASGTCDPSNNVTRWRVSKSRLYEFGSLKYSAGPFGWHTNCSLQTYTWTQTVPRDGGTGNMYSKAHFEWDASCGGCDFDEWIQSYSY